MLALEAGDTAVALVAVAVTALAAVLGWLATRGSDSTKMASDYMREISEDNRDLRRRVDALELENRDLKLHVDRCDADNAQLKHTADALQVRVQQLESVLRRLLGEDADALDGL